MNGSRVKLAMASYLVVLTAMVLLAVAGIRGSRVRDEMRQQLEIASEIPRLQASPQNERTVAAQESLRANVARELERARDELRRINARKLLLPNAFVQGTPDYAPYRFAELYRDAMSALARQLHAGGLPSPAEISAAQLEITEQQAFERERDDELPTGGPSTQLPLFEQTPRSTQRPRTPPPPHRATTPHPDSTSPDAQRLARTLKALSIRCYAEPDSFDLAPACVSPSPPAAEEMWFAQIGLWVQQDIVSAIAGLNEDAARAYPDSACVEQMPVKRILKLYVLGYLLADGLLPFPASDVNIRGPKKVDWESFTGRVCDEHFDVVIFRAILVVDQRDVLQLIDRISRQNLFRCTAVTYLAIPLTHAEQGYLYGSEPTVEVWLECEAYLATEIFHPLMPTEVRALLGTE